MRLVTVYLVETNPDGSKRIGNSDEVPVDEAISMIEADEAKSEHLPRGIVPPEWISVVEDGPEDSGS